MGRLRCIYAAERCDLDAGAPTAAQEYERLTGVPFDKARAVRHVSCGDGDSYYMPEGYELMYLFGSEEYLYKIERRPFHELPSGAPLRVRRGGGDGGDVNATAGQVDGSCRRVVFDDGFAFLRVYASMILIEGRWEPAE